MMTTPTITCAMITAGEPSLERAVASMRPHVDEMVVLVTRPSSSEDRERYEKLFDRVVVDGSYFPLKDDGEVDWSRADFAGARNASFALATKDFIMWADSDDEIVGGENLRTALAGFDPQARVRILAKYEYALDADGKSVVDQWRERVVRRGQPYSWKRPVHEYLTADDGNNGDVQLDTVTWRHHRPVNQPREERNLRILTAYEKRLGEAGQRDPWLRITLAQELQRSQRFSEALRHFEAYLELSDRTDEQALACIQASECALALGVLSFQQQEEAIRWCKRAREYRTSFETYYAEATVRYLRGMTGDRNELEWARCLLEEAIAQPVTHSPLAVKPQDRTHRAPELLRTACETLGDYRGAIVACDFALDATPDDAQISMQRSRYERLLARDAGAGTAKLGLDIVIACGPTIEKWNPVTAAERGIGGSETAVIEVAKRLVAQGHHVRVMADCGECMVVDGVWWLTNDYLRDIGACDVAIVWRNAALLECCKHATTRVLWAHDIAIHGMNAERALLCDRVFGLTEWHCEALRKAHGFHPSQMVHTRNGIDLDRFKEKTARNPHVAIYSSSPDRGLPVLLDVWPEIRKHVPSAELHVFYGFGGMDDAVERTGNEMLRYSVEQMKHRVRTTPGVVYHGRVDQKELAIMMMTSGVLAYPTHWTETSWIGGQEAQAAGLRIVTSSIAAIKETVGDRGVLIDGDWLSREYQERFAAEVVTAMLDNDDSDREARMAYARENFGWDGVVRQWIGVFDEMLADAEFGMMVPYQGVAE
jgi:glycosyltransferase involved in cell wall biosynthesis